jgi:orotidine 5'-phosphate decarboxylase subfamily 1
MNLRCFCRRFVEVSRGIRLAVVGATGAVGQETLKILQERDFPISELICLADPREEGTIIEYKGEAHTVRAASPQQFKEADVALFAVGREMMTAAVQSVQEEASRLNCSAPLALAVTVLTSISPQQLHDDMFITNRSVEQTVVDWALMAQECGMSGVVCSPQEIAPIRQACGSGFVIVTPGIRPLWSAKNDQKRITTPRDALKLGADYIVIGRPITAAQDPREAAQKIIDELEDL